MTPTPKFDYYAILDILRNASADEIKRAFRTRAVLYHPDKAACEAEKAYYTRLFQNINEAYTCLSNPDSRRKYDDIYLCPPGQLPNDPKTPTPLFLDLISACKTKEEVLKLKQEIDNMHLDVKIGKDEYLYLQLLIISKEKKPFLLLPHLKKIDKNWFIQIFDVLVELKRVRREDADQAVQVIEELEKVIGNFPSAELDPIHPSKARYYWQDEDISAATPK